MAVMDHNISLPRVGFISVLSDHLKAMKMKIAQHFYYRRTVRELESLSDHELEDIGLHRGIIRSSVRKLVYKN